MTFINDKLSPEQWREIADLMRARIKVHVDYGLGLSNNDPGIPMGTPQSAADELYLKMGIRGLEVPDSTLLGYFRQK